MLMKNHVAPLQELQPEFIGLCTGQRQILRSASFMAGFLSKGVGVEVMNKAVDERAYILLPRER